MKKMFSALIERDDDGMLIARVPDIHGCHTQARTMDELLPRISEAIKLCLEDTNAPYEPMEFVGIHQITID